MGFKSFLRKATPWAVGAGTFIATGGNIGAATMAGRATSSLLGKRKPGDGSGLNERRPSAYDSATGELSQARGNREADWADGDAEFGQAIEEYRDGSPDNVRGWDSSNLAQLNSDAFRRRSRSLDGVDTSRLRDWSPSGVKGFTSRLGDYTAPDLTSGAGSSISSEMARIRAQRSGGGPQSVGDVDVSSLESFDAGAAVKEYATGAWDQVQAGLKSTLRDLKYDAAARHRMNSGWFDEDQGRVVTDTAANFQSELAKQAVTAAGITADARGRAAALRVQRAGDRDRFAVDAFGLQLEGDRDLLSAASDIDRLRQEGRTREAELAYEALSEGERQRLDALKTGDSLSLEALQSGTDAEIRRAQGADALDLEAIQAADVSDRDRATTRDTLGLRRAEYLDTDSRERSRGVADLRESRLRLRGGRAEAAQDRYYDWLSGNADRELARDNAKAERRGNRLQSLIGLGGLAIDAYGAWKGRGGSTSRTDPFRPGGPAPRGSQIMNGPANPVG